MFSVTADENSKPSAALSEAEQFIKLHPVEPKIPLSPLLAAVQLATVLSLLQEIPNDPLPSATQLCRAHFVATALNPMPVLPVALQPVMVLEPPVGMPSALLSLAAQLRTRPLAPMLMPSPAAPV